MIPYFILAIEDPSDREFMADLYTNYHRLMYSEIFKMLKDDWATEDVLQTALEHLIDHLSTLKMLDRNETVNYIITACKHNALNYIRDNKKHVEFTFNEDLDSFSEDESLCDDRMSVLEMMENVSEAWQRLDKRSQRVLEMKYILDCSDEEIAAAVHVAPSSVRMLLTRARKKLKALIGETEEV